MKSSFYSFHLDFKNFFDAQSRDFRVFRKTNLYQSIDEHLKLLFMTSEGEYRFDHQYGTIVSELDFSNEKQTGIYERIIERSLAQAIAKYEPRLEKVSVDVKFNRTGIFFVTPESKSFKLSIIFKVEAKIVDTQEDYKNSFEIFFSPLSE
jgi:predicted component of type VI protein secretion system